ncbi:trypsin-like serine peptidase [Jannaschia sp. LMIT008]|uniref:trypsin-like serine peptidase n=1 Tax=Jannaschia maritima TaxID=3032585 RepID=UPI002812287B|nr:trypsin-like serine protease [Jannaschia sp. LMIT008]
MCAALAASWLAAAAWADTAPLQALGTADQARGWEAVGRLDFGRAGFCTAALVTEEIVLTAAHCLFDTASGIPVVARDIAFQVGLRHGRAEARRGVRRIVIHPGYDRHEPDALATIGADLALLELDRPVRLRHVRPFRAAPQVDAGQAVQVVSYARNRADAPARQDGCAVLTRDQDVLVLDCTVDFGSSGAPVFADVDGEVRIVSVISAKASWGDRPVALGAAMEGELDALLDVFARTPALAPVGKRVRPPDGAVRLPPETVVRRLP